MQKKTGSTFDQKSYMNEYISTKVVYRRINFSRSKPDEMKMVEWLDGRPEGVAAYLKQLIQEDMNKARA